MATIVVTQPNATVAVSNGDRVIIDIPGGGTVTVVAASPNVRNFQVDFADDTQADTLRVDTSTFQRDGLQILVRDYDPSDRIKLLGTKDGGISLSQSNQYDFSYQGADGGVYGGRVRILDPGERNLGNQPPPIIICFGEGTIISTDIGPRPVETLRAGDLVETVDNGFQPVIWVGKRAIGPLELEAAPHLHPVLVRAGAMGDGLPWRDLVLSPQHRVWLSDWRAELFFGEPEVLMPVKALMNGETILPAPVTSVTYYHILFERHEVVISNGLRSESLHPGNMAISALDEADIVSLGEAFDDLMFRETARPVLRTYEARAVATA